MRSMVFVLAPAAFFGPAVASAHVALMEPAARYARDFVKSGPCGHPDNPAGGVVATFAPGETITVRWDEYIGHPGHFRIALSPEGDGAFVDPTDYDDLYSAPNVLLDDIEDPAGRRDHAVELTLPADLECEACVLQLIQVMTDKPPWGPEGGNELYYQCADIRISADGVPVDGGGSSGGGGASTDTGEASQDDGGSGCGCGPPERSGVTWALLSLVGLAVRRRRGLGYQSAKVSPRVATPSP